MEELPWVAALEPLRTSTLAEQERCRRSLEEVAALTLASFPHAIVPNKLLQEMNALAKGAKLDLPLVEEVAADIFRGRFSDKFLVAAQRASRIVGGTLYSDYYRIDYSRLGSPPAHPAESRLFRQFRRQPRADENKALALAELCAERANVRLGGWSPATNGMIIEQQQILTTQNLAVLFEVLGLGERLRLELPTMAQKCFAWICRRQQLETPDWHARLIVIKNTAYAWRQMLFYLALLPTGEVHGFLNWATDHFREQPDEFRRRFGPAVNGLSQAVAGVPFEDGERARRFLGWSKERHWLQPIPPESRKPPR